SVELLERPRQHGLKPRRQQGRGLGRAHPAELVVLGPAELWRVAEPHVRAHGLGEVIARHLAATVGSGLDMLVAKAEAYVAEAGLLGELASGGLEGRLAGHDLALGKIPVAIGAQDEQAPGW